MVKMGWPAFAGGVSLLLAFSSLPDPRWLVCGSLLGLLVGIYQPIARQAGWLLLGLAWGVWQAGQYQHRLIPVALEGQSMEIRARIDGLPLPAPHHRIRVRIIPEQLGPWPSGQMWEMNAPAGDYRPGDLWRFKVSLKRPQGSASPGAFDLEAWMMSEGVTATGIIRSASRLTSGRGGIDRWRLDIREDFAALALDKPEAGVVLALLTGDRALVPETVNELYQATGISHLMAISGPHVLLFAWAVCWFFRRVVSCFPRLYRYQPLPGMHWPLMLLAAIGYGALAGFGLPTVRTLVMLAVCTVARLGGRQPDSWAVLGQSLGLVLLWQPLSVHAAGFWLSFGVVALIQLFAGWKSRQPSWWQAVRLQFWLFAVLAPITLLIFGKLSLISPLANLPAIPLVSFVVVPLAIGGLLIGSAWSAAGEACWYWATCVVEALNRFLHVLIDSGPEVIRAAVTPLTLVFLAGTVFILMAPRRMTPRLLALFCLLPVLLRTSAIPHGHLRMAVLDVGQGLAVVLQTRQHVLLYDTGPSESVGERVVVPYLDYAGIRRLDRLVLSHNDLDHTGGATPVIAAVPVREVLFSALPETYRPAVESRQDFCQAGTAWQWDGVDFLILSPGSGMGQLKDNDRSCVIRVSGAGYSVLLTGDIEAVAERGLLQHADALRSDVLLLPHHGSQTSSTAAFIAAVRPGLGIVSAGYRNRFHHPDKRVVGRYRLAGVPLVSTVESGTLRYEWGPGGFIHRETWRGGRHYWQNQP
jgi:competence protein ComEC